jgi:hypothetical protein
MAANTLVTPDVIRLFMLDRTAADNFLLDDIDMPQDLLDLSISLVVDEYNTTTPIVGNCMTVESFPYRLELVLGVAGRLLKSKGMNLLRNDLSHQSASGNSINDKAKATAYVELGNQFLEEFKNRIKMLKQHINVEEGFGFVSGPPRF